MGLFDKLLKTEERVVKQPNAPVSADDILHIIEWGDFSSTAGVTVNADNALSASAIAGFAGVKRHPDIWWCRGAQ